MILIRNISIRTITSSSNYEIVKHYDHERNDKLHEYAICRDLTYGKRKQFKLRKIKKDIDCDLDSYRRRMKEIGTKYAYYRRGLILFFGECTFVPRYTSCDEYGHSSIADWDLPTIYVNDN